MQRFKRSAETHGFNVKVLGFGEMWLGGDVTSYPGGGQKVRFLRDALEPFSEDTENLLLFVDSYDVVFMDSVDSFLRKYEALQHRVIFSAEKFCWPQPSLMSKYPVVDENESRFLNSGSFVGPIADIFRIISHSPIENADDDQLFYTKIFLDPDLRQELDIALDTRSELFQNLNGALDDIRVDYNEDTGYLVNTRTNTRPVIAHGNGPIKVQFNSLTNYLARTWTPSKGCLHCREDNINLDELSPDAYPVIQISAFITAPTPFVDDFFKDLDQLNYPKKRIHLTLYCNVEEHYAALLEFNVTRGYEYRSAIVISEDAYKTDISAKNHAWSLCLGHEDCAFVLTIDSMARLTNPDTLNHLVRMNRNVMAPLLTRIGKLWSNFWGALNHDGYYARSFDYVDIINRKKKQVHPTPMLLQGIWNVPFVSNCYMFSRWTARQLVNHLPQEDSFPDMTLSRLIREKNIFLFVDNQEYFGHLVNPDTYGLNHLHNDMWQIFDNPVEWERKYLHPDYHKYVNRSFGEFEQPCPDVFWFPLLSEKFCKDMIEELEVAGLWSTGSNIDPRLEGGYENVPTIDTHMRQIDWEAPWLHILATYVRPIQRIVFEGYEDLPTARMNFVVRYKPDEQHSLRPHHDASTYTLNVALNRPGFDYQARECLTHSPLLTFGGGARFVRYDCAVVRSRLGWALMHPGRLTHLHEGLRTTHALVFTSPLHHLLLLLAITASSVAQVDELHVIGLRGEMDDAVERFERSIQVFGYTHTLLDLSAYGRTTSEVPFGRKVQALRQFIDNISAEHVLILDSHSSILLNNPADPIKQAERIGADFIFVETDVNSGKNLPSGDAIFTGMMARTKRLKELLDGLSDDLSEDLVDEFLNMLHSALSRDSTRVAIDEGSALFQIVNKDSGAYLKVRYEGDRGYVQNVHKDTVPPILIASPEGKHNLNSLSNYLVRAWSPETGCQICDEGKLDLSRLSHLDYPVIQLSVLVTEPTPFLEVFFESVANLTYPKNRIDLVTYCAVEKQKSLVDDYVAKTSHEYRSNREIRLPPGTRPIEAFREALSYCWENNGCKYLFYMEPTTQLRKVDTLEHLVSTKRNAIAPMMTRPGKFWSSFWGALTDEGAYARSDDYFDIVERRQTGIWNVPLVGSSVLFSRWAVGQLQEALEDSGFLLYDIASAALLRNIFLFVDNRKDFGHLVNPETYTLNHLHNDLWQIFDNPTDWEERYIHPEYFRFVNASTTLADFEQPCPDVFWVPLMSETFCKQLIEEMEHFGKWSDGSNYDPRLEGGYENVPTVDIHMRQVDWEEHWMHVLQKYVYPIQLKLWEGYYDKPTARMNFVVRYKQGEQPSLRLHHDASTYTLDMALNRAHIDYTGGGVRYPRYNCTLVDTRVGWPLIFPGRLTHLHEGMETTSGVRYIFVTFVNP
ncbi:unnamed protein product [Taenia asiatica]|uniref:Fe2OG dioxygenase domain-containing protein n=1 Tax=Taenia asiatica TaxID=60517 RepID=A0A3P6P6V4_TAEAS|nr:unnamed protein product [Taenia asiatica]